MPQQSEDVPAETDWYVKIDKDYPHGAIDLWPARVNGITTTFQHQNANVEPCMSIEAQPWREGRLCVDEADVHLAGEQFVGQATSAKGKLLWHCERAREWLKAAIGGTLSAPGDHYEPPHYNITAREPIISYVEDQESLEWWASRYGQVISIRFRNLHQSALFVFEIDGQDGDWRQTPWGAAIASAGLSSNGCCLVFSNVLTSHRHHAPHTWGEFRLAARRQGITLDELLATAIGQARKNRAGFFLLVGHPIPKLVDQRPVEISFHALEFPVVDIRKSVSDAAALKWMVRDGPLADATRLKWLPTYNLGRNHMTVRGELCPNLTDAAIAIIGCGALGSVIAEILVRMGARRISLVDHDVLEPGNLVRHTLTLSDIGSSKSRSLAQRLNRCSPFASVTAFDTWYPYGESQAAVCSADVVVDCSASDYVIATPPNEASDRWLFSFSLGIDAKELFSYSSRGTWFSQGEFDQAFQPFLEKMRGESIGMQYRDIGCHNPTFPAPYDRIVAHAGRSVAFMNAIIAEGSGVVRTQVSALARNN